LGDGKAFRKRTSQKTCLNPIFYQLAFGNKGLAEIRRNQDDFLSKTSATSSFNSGREYSSETHRAQDGDGSWEKAKFASCNFKVSKYSHPTPCLIGCFYFWKINETKPIPER
jgi:hypothetical protein